MHRNERNPQNETRRSIIILTASGLAIAASSAALAMLRRSPRQAETACVAGVASRKIIILVDHTDPWSPSTATLLTAHLRRIADSAATEERLVMLPFNGNAASLPEPVFDRCKPPSTGNLLLDTPQRLTRMHAAQFTTPLLGALEKLASPASASRTELVQILAALATNANLDGSANATSFHVFSDMDENSTGFSFVRKPAQSIDRFATHFAGHIGTRLKGIDLNIHVMPPPVSPARSDPRPDPRIERAWRAALASHQVRFTWEPL